MQQKIKNKLCLSFEIGEGVQFSNVGHLEFLKNADEGDSTKIFMVLLYMNWSDAGFKGYTPQSSGGKTNPDIWRFLKRKMLIEQTSSYGNNQCLCLWLTCLSSIDVPDVEL